MINESYAPRRARRGRSPRHACVTAALLLAACGSAANQGDDAPGGGASGSAGSSGSAATSAGAGGADQGSGGAGTAAGSAHADAGAAGGASGAAADGSAAGAAAGGSAGTGAAASGDAGGSGGNSGSSAGAGGSDAGRSAGCGVAGGLESGRASLDVDGTAREYILKLPEGYDPSTPYRLIFAWHWRGGSADQVVSYSAGPYYGLEERAAGAAIFVAPEGIDAGFANTDGRDIAFLRAMLDLFESQLCIDTQRIFSTGFSFGGMMSDAIGCEMSDVFRAIAPMSGGLPSAEHHYSGCNPTSTHPIAVWMSHGTSDLVVPIADGEAARDLFVERNGCQAQTGAVEPSPCVAYQGCAQGYPVHWCEFAGGHAAPSFAPDAIWAFFAQF